MTPYMEMKLMAETAESNRLEVQSKLDRVTAERDAALAELKTQTLRADAAVGDANEAEQRLTAADERNDSRDSEIFAQVQSALRRSFSLGQIYWQQADSDSTCQQNKSDQTMEVQEQHILNVLKSLGAALKPAEISAQQNRCESCNGSGTKADAETGIDSGCAVCGGSGDAPAEGGGDDR